ncbi:hypothetical protein KC19_8G115100 [Ceratodon purpureus]|uniref:Uncharacterized protein n=1 Tax=Ceratodon purpureus TaxID=3225 RepID=A0A8T0H318_CERPU|nr:hypothetical protein KC19_8G115100 [Ceratodon purpureus]
MNSPTTAHTPMQMQACVDDSKTQGTTSASSQILSLSLCQAVESAQAAMNGILPSRLPTLILSDLDRPQRLRSRSPSPSLCFHAATESRGTLTRIHNVNRSGPN